MKTINKPSQAVLWDGCLGRVIGIGEGRDITIKILEDKGKNKCPHCGGLLDTYITHLEHSPMFQSSITILKSQEEIDNGDNT